jgi:hypothetical protein
MREAPIPLCLRAPYIKSFRPHGRFGTLSVNRSTVRLTALPVLVVAGVLAAAIIFALVSDLAKVPVFRLLGIT